MKLLEPTFGAEKNNYSEAFSANYICSPRVTRSERLLNFTFVFSVLSVLVQFAVYLFTCIDTKSINPINNKSSSSLFHFTKHRMRRCLIESVRNQLCSLNIIDFIINACTVHNILQLQKTRKKFIRVCRRIPNGQTEISHRNYSQT